MASIKFSTEITITDSNTGSLTFSTANTTTFTAKSDMEYAITADTEQIIFNPTSDTSEPSSDFDFLYITSSAECELEIETDTGADVGREMIVVTLAANTPFVLGSDASKANITAFDGFGGTADVIDKITAKAGSADATLRAIIVT